MKPQEMKLEFVRLRADGQSYDKIAKALHISKATCSAWEREFKADISRLQQEGLNELYQSYGMAKEARIRRIGGTLQQIETALQSADLSTMPPERLLDFKLKYAQALKEEFTGLTQPPTFTGRGEPKEVQAAFMDIYERVRRGDITAEQAGQELKALTSLLQAYEAVETKERIDAIDTMISGRRALHGR